jgi:hypothetical protein
MRVRRRTLLMVATACAGALLLLSSFSEVAVLSQLTAAAPGPEGTALAETGQPATLADLLQRSRAFELDQATRQQQQQQQMTTTTTTAAAATLPSPSAVKAASPPASPRPPAPAPAPATSLPPPPHAPPSFPPPPAAAAAAINTGCVSWRQTGPCSPPRHREPDADLPCDSTVPKGASGYCECAGGQRAAEDLGCDHGPFRCVDKCADSAAVASSVREREQFGSPVTIGSCGDGGAVRCVCVCACAALLCAPSPQVMRLILSIKLGILGPSSIVWAA